MRPATDVAGVGLEALAGARPRHGLVTRESVCLSLALILTMIIPMRITSLRPR